MSGARGAIAAEPGYRVLTPDDPCTPGVERLLGLSFGYGAEFSRQWMDRIGFDRVRVLEDGGRAAGALMLIDMGQFFGGRSVPMMGVQGVGVAPAARGRRIAHRMMCAALRECREKGFPISTLYPATSRLYRASGYERAGERFRYTLPLKMIELEGERGALEVRPVEEADHGAVEACQRAHASKHDGNIDRDGFMWDRARRPRGETAHGFAAWGPDGVEGYLAYVIEKVPDAFYNLNVSDFIAATPAAVRSLLGLLRDHRSIGDKARWFGPAVDPALMVLAEQTWTSERDTAWMVRIVDIAGAFGARGYRAAIEGELHLDIGDDVIPENGGRWVVAVRDGGATVERGGEGSLRMGVRALAPMFTGHLRASELARIGMLEGSAGQIALADSILGGGSPWMSEMF